MTTIETAIDARLRDAVLRLKEVIDTDGARSPQVRTACAQVTTAAKGATPEQQRGAGIADWQPEPQPTN